MARKTKTNVTGSRLRLQPDESGRAALERTMAAYGELLAWLERTIPEDRSANLVTLHREWYGRARATAPDLPAQLTTLAFKDWASRRRGERAEGVPYDQRLYAIRGVSSLALATLSGRITVSYAADGYRPFQLGGVPARLVGGADGWEFRVGIEDPAILNLQHGGSAMTSEGVLSRIGRVMTGMAHAVVSAAEQANPEATLEQAIREIDAAAEDVRTELGKALAERHRIVARLKELESERAEIEDKIKHAIAQKRDDLAEAGISRQLDIESQTSVLARVLADVEERAGQLESMVEAIRASRREAESRLRDLRQSHAAAPGGPDSKGSNAVGRAQAKVERAQAVAERVTGVPGGPAGAHGPALEELDRLHREHAIKERLARLKLGRG